jgi:hypothetical protein
MNDKQVIQITIKTAYMNKLNYALVIADPFVAWNIK